MRIDAAQGQLRRLRRSLEGLEQRTFRTPLQRLAPFVDRLVGNDPPFGAATVFVQQTVFTPKHLEKLLSSHKLPVSYGADNTIRSETAVETAALLEAALADWVDFYFVPSPRDFVLYADHDEYSTLFAARKGTLSRLADGLSEAGVSEVSGYRREF